MSQLQIVTCFSQHFKLKCSKYLQIKSNTRNIKKLSISDAESKYNDSRITSISCYI